MSINELLSEMSVLEANTRTILKRTHLEALTLTLPLTAQATKQLNSQGTRFYMAYTENITLHFNREQPLVFGCTVTAPSQ